MTFGRKRRHAPVPITGSPGGVPGVSGRRPSPAIQSPPPGYAGRPAYGHGGQLPAYGGHPNGAGPSPQGTPSSYGPSPHRVSSPYAPSPHGASSPYGPAAHGIPSAYAPPSYGAPPQPYATPAQYGPPAPGHASPAERGRRREPAPTSGPVGDEDERWAVPAYVGIFVGGFVAPAIVYFAKGRTSPFARFHAVQALNLCIAMTVCDLIVYGLLYVIGFTGLFVALAAIAVQCLCVVKAAIGANRCEWYRLPSAVAWPILR